MGQLWIDCLTFAEALEEIECLVEDGDGGSVFTPNIDHVVNAETNAAFREAYQAANLCVVDGKPLVWASRFLGARLPERICGADLVIPLIERAAQRKWSIYLLGGGHGVAEAAAAELKKRFGVKIAGVDAPTVSFGPDPDEDAVMERVRAADPQLVLVALGAPKQELWIHRARHRIRPAVAIGVGATLSFIAGHIRRAPAWLSSAGLEWLFRITQEPRLVQRYLIRDPKILPILLRTMRLPREQRVQGA
jgi:N-acetylglucosaminyldiphosphoundecaprenol N-acetyl-beta-D-mannosaminyltransferase